MRRLVNTLDLPKTEWLRYRKLGITGTDAGAICGMNPFRSAFEVYQDKLNTDIIESEDNEAMRQGRDLEEYVAQRFCEATGYKVRRANAIFCNEEYPFMLADFDRLIVGMDAGLECKTVSPYGADKWANGNIPAHYQLQCQHYMAVSGAKSWYIAALIYGKELIIREIKRDEELTKFLITIESKFWNENIQKRIMPDPDGTKKCSEEIAKMYFKSDSEQTISLIGFDETLRRRDELSELIEKLEKEKASIDQRIQLEMGEAGYAVSDNYRVSWLTTESRRIDTKRLKEERPDLYQDYSKVSTCRRFLVKPAA